MFERYMEAESQVMGRAQLVSLAKRTIQEFLDDRCLSSAASIAYYGFFSLFPLILLLIAIFGQALQSPGIRDEVLAQVGTYLPGARDFVLATIDGAVRARGPIGVVSAITLLWSASGIFGSTSEGVNNAWGVREGRPIIQQNALNLALVIAAAFFFFVSMALTALFRLFSTLVMVEFFPLNLLWGLVGALLPLMFTLVLFLIIYKVLPYRRVTWREALVGAVLASVLFEIMKNVFAWYVQNLSNYNLVYGSLGTVVVLLTWVYLSAVILLLGAELSSEYAFQRRRALVARQPVVSELEREPTLAFAIAVGLLTLSAIAVRSISLLRAERGRKLRVTRLLRG